MKCEKFQGITTEEACLAQQKARKILCQNCDQRQGGDVVKKHCPKCGEDKPDTEFSPDKKSKDGKRYYCKACTSAITRGYQQKKKGLPPASPETELVPKAKLQRRPAVKKEAAAPTIQPLLVKIDFQEYPQLYEFIMRGPKEFLRTPENMILYAVAALMKEVFPLGY